MIIYGKEKEVMKAQKRSLAAWINNTVGATLVDADNLIPKLSTGVILCKLAKCIQMKADESKGGYYGKDERLQRLKYWESAKRETFFARDNAEMFIRWCKSFGVRDAVLFESDGLVLQSQPRTVILCLLELSRLSSKYGVLLPPPIQMPPSATLAVEDDDDISGDSEDDEDAFFYAPATTPAKFQRWDSGCSSGPRSPSPSSPRSKASSSPSSSLMRRSGIPLRKRETKNVVVVVEEERRLQSVKLPRVSSPAQRRILSSVRTDTVSSRLRSSLNRSTSSLASTRSLGATIEKPREPLLRRGKSDLDKRVLELARKYHKDETKICRLSEGHYNFDGKNVYLRIVRGNNVVVRLGGGWDTLEHFLSVLDLKRAQYSKRDLFQKGNQRQSRQVKNVTYTNL